jgi:hypothetical protein
MPNLIDRITQLFSRQAKAASDTAQVTPTAARPLELTHKLRAEQERSALVRICNEMYETDARCEGSINTLARDVAKGGFTVKSDNPRAADVAQAAIERLNLQSVLDDYVRETLIEGDSLIEVGVSDDPLITSLTRKPTLHIQRYTDRSDRFSDPRRAFWYSDQHGLFSTLEAPSDAIWFAEWQMIHMRWNHRTKRRYGRPLYASAVASWKRVTEGELDMAVRRKTRAGLRYLHVVEGADVTELEQYRTNNKAALEDPYSGIADFFSNRAGGISAIQGDARLNDIDDVIHHIETWWTASPVPMVLIGYGKDLNRDVLEQKLTQYERALEGLTQWLEDDFVRPLLEREWLLNGIYPEALKYELVWRYKGASTTADLKNVADAIIRFKALGMPEAIIWSLTARFLPWLDVTALLDASATADATSGETDAQPGRLDTVLGAQA